MLSDLRRRLISRWKSLRLPAHYQARASSKRSRRNMRVGTDTMLLENRLVLSPVAVANDSFESGLPAHWSIPDVGGEGRVSIRNLVTEGLIEVPLSAQFSTTGNEHALVFDSSRASGDSVDDLGVAIMNIDLSSATSALLTFHQLEGLRGDINDVLPTSHALTATGDGLAISNDGSTWYTMKNVQGGNINRGGDGLWQLFEFDLFANIDRLNADEGAGLSTSSPLQIKFSQYDDDVFPRRGWAIDNVQLRATAGTFDVGAPRGVFHRYDLAGEDDRDYYYRAAVFGDVDATTPTTARVTSTDNTLTRSMLLHFSE